jgi:hypothetical protein
MKRRPAALPPVAGIALLPVILLIVGIFACSIYANLSFAVTKPGAYRFFPPFKANVDANQNGHLGGEAFNVARSLTAGKGFADPFTRSTGATAWMPPVLPTLLAGLLWVFDGDNAAVMGVVVFLQVFVLIGTGLLVLALVRQTSGRVGTGVAAAVYLGALLCHFHLCFQSTRDCWIVLLAVDLLVAGLCWLGPLDRWQTAAGWGLVGGFGAQINPIVGFTWGILSLVMGFRARSWSGPALAILVAALTLLPWTVRNYLVFGRFIPIKANLAYELFQSQCLEPDGLCQSATIALHPHTGSSQEAQAYNVLGENAYLERKQQQFWQAVRADPLEFVKRLMIRLAGATLWYVPFDRDSEPRHRPWVPWVSRLVHPLPFLAVLMLLVTARWRPLHWTQWSVIGVYLLYLLPYIVVSYFERYAIPLLGIKVLLVLWATDALFFTPGIRPSVLGKGLGGDPPRLPRKDPLTEMPASFLPDHAPACPGPHPLHGDPPQRSQCWPGRVLPLDT